jgi:hypothetical protein
VVLVFTKMLLAVGQRAEPAGRPRDPFPVIVAQVVLPVTVTIGRVALARTLAGGARSAERKGFRDPAESCVDGPVGGGADQHAEGNRDDGDKHIG